MQIQLDAHQYESQNQAILQHYAEIKQDLSSQQVESPPSLYHYSPTHQYGSQEQMQASQQHSASYFQKPEYKRGGGGGALHFLQLSAECRSRASTDDCSFNCSSSSSSETDVGCSDFLAVDSSSKIQSKFILIEDTPIQQSASAVSQNASKQKCFADLKNKAEAEKELQGIWAASQKEEVNKVNHCQKFIVRPDLNNSLMRTGSILVRPRALRQRDSSSSNMDERVALRERISKCLPVQKVVPSAAVQKNQENKKPVTCTLVRPKAAVSSMTAAAMVPERVPAPIPTLQRQSAPIKQHHHQPDYKFRSVEDLQAYYDNSGSCCDSSIQGFSQYATTLSYPQNLHYMPHRSYIDGYNQAAAWPLERED